MRIINIELILIYFGILLVLVVGKSMLTSNKSGAVSSLAKLARTSSAYSMLYGCNGHMISGYYHVIQLSWLLPRGGTLTVIGRYTNYITCTMYTVKCTVYKIQCTICWRNMLKTV